MPEGVPEANPPSPSASSHSVRSSMFTVSSSLGRRVAATRRLGGLDDGAAKWRSTAVGGRLASAWLQQFGHEPGPPGLVRRTDAPARVAVEVLVKEHVVPEVRVVLYPGVVSQDGALAFRVAQEQPRQARRELARHLLYREIPARSRGALDLEVIAVVVVKLLKRLDDQVIHRHPNRPAPVRVPAEKSRIGFAGLVLDAEPLAGPLERIRS